jgi:hypothetical protein
MSSFSSYFCPSQLTNALALQSAAGRNAGKGLPALPSRPIAMPASLFSQYL